MGLSTILDKLELVSRFTGIIAAIFTIMAIFLPAPLWKPIEAYVASVYGANGWVYYEVGENRQITNDGNFYLLKETETGYYPEIKIGDKLRVAGDVNFRSEADKDSARSFVLINGDCVIVTEAPGHPVDVQVAKSGGWLRVATAPCGLF